MKLLLLLTFLTIAPTYVTAADLYRHKVTAPLIGCSNERILNQMAYFHEENDLKSMKKLLDGDYCDNFAKYAVLYTKTEDPCLNKAAHNTTTAIRPHDKTELVIYCGNFTDQ